MVSSAETQKLRSPIADEIANARKLATRRVWLPKILYDGLPWFYVFAGSVAILATLYVNDWFWIVPYYVLFAAGCLHLGILIFRKRGAGGERLPQIPSGRQSSEQVP